MRFPNRSRIAAVVLALAGVNAVPSMASAQGTGIASQPAKSKPEVKAIELEVSPMPASAPVFRYRLLPRESDRTPGDAAPIYLRLSTEDNEEARRQLREKPHEWLQLPPDKFPKVEARAFVDQFSKRLRQIEYGSRRRTCDWNYTVPEEGDRVFEISLPDAQEMRVWGRLVALKARVEIAEGKFAEAARTFETGFSFARQVGEGPFFINVLIGISVGSQMLALVDEWIDQPNAPNLYWPLTALPRPLVPVRDSMEQEQKPLDTFVPELDDLERPRADAEWSLLLSRLHARMSYFRNLLAAGGDSNQAYPSRALDPESFKASLLPEARAFVKDRRGSIDGYADDRLIMLYAADRYREFRDDLFKQAYLPVPDSSALWPDADKRLHALKASPLGLFAQFAPAVAAVQSAECRLDRKVAALRAVEAIRIQAHADGGKLPESLAKVTAVPVPLDPSTGKPFEYRLDGDTATLTSPLFLGTRLTYRVTLRN